MYTSICYDSPPTCNCRRGRDVSVGVSVSGNKLAGLSEPILKKPCESCSRISACMNMGTSTCSCVYDQCMLTYVMTVYLIAGEMENCW